MKDICLICFHTISMDSLTFKILVFLFNRSQRQSLKSNPIKCDCYCRMKEGTVTTRSSIKRWLNAWLKDRVSVVKLERSLVASALTHNWKEVIPHKLSVHLIVQHRSIKFRHKANVFQFFVFLPKKYLNRNSNSIAACGYCKWILIKFALN